MNLFETIDEDIAAAFVLRSRNTTVMMLGMSARQLSAPDLSIHCFEPRHMAFGPKATDTFSS
jgi:hypothetical protein